VTVAPHAEFVVRSAMVASPEDMPLVVPLPDDLPFHVAPYYPLVCGAVSWIEIEEAGPDHALVILGQGLVGMLMLQVAKASGSCHVIAVDVLAPGGLIHLIGLYENEPLPLHSGKIQGKRPIGGYYRQVVNARISRRALEFLRSGTIRTDLMTTHWVHCTEGPKAHELLYSRPREALGALPEW